VCVLKCERVIHSKSLLPPTLDMLHILWQHVALSLVWTGAFIIPWLLQRLIMDILEQTVPICAESSGQTCPNGFNWLRFAILLTVIACIAVLTVTLLFHTGRIDIFVKEAPQQQTHATANVFRNRTTSSVDGRHSMALQTVKLNKKRKKNSKPASWMAENQIEDVSAEDHLWTRFSVPLGPEQDQD
jgi:hypothetical protein